MGITKVLASSVFLTLTLAGSGLAGSATIPLKGNESVAERQKLAKITEAVAKATALQHVKGEIVEVELENEHGFLIYSVEVKTPKGKVEVQIDAGNGAFVGVENEEDEHHDKD